MLYVLERCNLFFVTQYKKHFKPLTCDILLSVTYACFMVVVTSFQIVCAQVHVLYAVFSHIFHYVSQEEIEMFVFHRIIFVSYYKYFGN